MCFKWTVKCSVHGPKNQNTKLREYAPNAERTRSAWHVTKYIECAMVFTQFLKKILIGFHSLYDGLSSTVWFLFFIFIQST